MVLPVRSASRQSQCTRNPAAFTFSPPPLTIQPKYETSDVKMPSKRSPRVKHPEGSQPNSIFDGVLTFTAINSSMALVFVDTILCAIPAELAKANKEPVFSTHSDMSSYSTKSINSDQDSDAMHIKKAPVMAVTPTGEEIDIFEIYQVPNSSR
jgi:hypothetical protein